MLDQAVLLGFMVLLIFLIAVLVQAWRRRSNFLWAFAIAWGTPIGLAMFRVLHALHLIEWPWIDQSTVLSMGVEALVASLGVAYRIYLLSRERDLARADERVARRLADTDPLTGLFNRRAFLEQAIGRSGPQTLILADIDHFKRINDLLGHDGGDEVLRIFANALGEAAGMDMLIARIGGEIRAARRCRTRPPRGAARPASRHPLSLRSVRHRQSRRVHRPDRRRSDWRLLYREADQALFAAKDAGRDRACRGATITPPAAERALARPAPAH